MTAVVPRWFFYLESIWVVLYLVLCTWAYAMPDAFELRADIYSLRVHVAIIAVALSKTAMQNLFGASLIVTVALASDVFNLVELSLLPTSSSIRAVAMAVASYQVFLTVIFITFLFLGRRRVTVPNADY